LASGLEALRAPDQVSVDDRCETMGTVGNSAASGASRLADDSTVGDCGELLDDGDWRAPRIEVQAREDDIHASPRQCAGCIHYRAIEEMCLFDGDQVDAGVCVIDQLGW